MIKKITIILVCILVAAVAVTVLINRGTIQTPSIDSPLNSSNGTKSGSWIYETEDGTVTITGYSGRETTIQIPEELDGLSVTKIGESLFADNTRIKEVFIPNSVTEIGSSSFENCTALTNVSLSSSLTRISAKAFSGCKSLVNIQLPSGIKQIGSNAFNGCSELVSIIIPSGVTNIGSEAFLNCSKLSEIDIPRTVNSIGTHAFKGTPWLNAQTDNFVIIGNQILIKYNGIDETVEVPLGVTSITDAFEDNIFPMEIILPSSLTSIGPHAFSGCRSLETIRIPDSVRSIGDSAFRGCTHLAPVDLPESLTTIGTSAFQSCSALERIIIPYGVRSIPSLAFANCEKLRSVQIPESVSSIADNAFVYSGLSELRVVRGSAGETYALNNNINYYYQQQSTGDFVYQQTEEGVQIVLYIGSLYDVVIPERISGETVTSLSDILFQHNSYVRTVSLPRSITRIADFSFANMSDLRTVTFPDNLESIGAAAFQNDSMLGDLEIPDSVIEIADDAFTGCPSLIIIANEDSYAFEWAVSNGIRVKTKSQADVTSFKFVQPEGLTMIASYFGSESSPELPKFNEYGEIIYGISAEAFRGADISSIEIPDGYESIEDYAFADIPDAFEISIPRSVASIADNCFENTQVIFHGYNGSYAETYARAHGIKFLVIADWEL